MIGASRKVLNNKCKSVQVSFLHKLIKLHNLVTAGHKHEIYFLAIFENCVYQSKSSRCKLAHIKVKLNEPLSNHWITVLGIPGVNKFDSGAYSPSGA